MFLSSTSLFVACCFVGFAFSVIIPGIATWGSPQATGIASAILTGAMPLLLRGHQRSVVISGTAYVAAACIAAYLAFGTVSHEGQWEFGRIEFVLCGLAFLLWVVGLAAASISFSLSVYPLVFHLTLPLVAFLLFRVSQVF